VIEAWFGRNKPTEKAWRPDLILGSLYNSVGPPQVEGIEGGWYGSACSNVYRILQYIHV